MAKMSFREASGLVLGEIGRVLGRVEEAAVQALEEAVVAAEGVFVTGEGRSGLVGRCFAMRLMHLGLRAHVVGETVTPAIGAGDLLVAVSGSGETQVTCGHARRAAEAGAKVAAVTAARGSTLAASASVVVLVPARDGGEGSAQYGGSLFEQASLVVLDAVVVRLQARLGETAEQMAARHTTLE